MSKANAPKASKAKAARPKALGPQALRKAAAALTEAELKALLAYVRTRTTNKLLALAAPPPKAKTPATAAKPKSDALVAEVTAMMSPILGPAGEKAELLLEACAAPSDVQAKSLGEAIRKLRRLKHKDEAIAAAAKALMARIAKRHGMRETVT